MLYSLVILFYFIFLYFCCYFFNQNNRFSKDQGTLDQQLMMVIHEIMECLLAAFCAVGTVCLVSPILIPPCIVLGLLLSVTWHLLHSPLPTLHSPLSTLFPSRSLLFTAGTRDHCLTPLSSLPLPSLPSPPLLLSSPLLSSPLLPSLLLFTSTFRNFVFLPAALLPMHVPRAETIEEHLLLGSIIK